MQVFFKLRNPKLDKYLYRELLYSDISNFTFGSVNILKCKNFLISFLNELGNFKQKTSKGFEQ